jgi:hypothetical protein
MRATPGTLTGIGEAEFPGLATSRAALQLAPGHGHGTTPFVPRRFQIIVVETLNLPNIFKTKNSPAAGGPERC